MFVIVYVVFVEEVEQEDDLFDVMVEGMMCVLIQGYVCSY